MNRSEILANAVPVEDASLKRLQYWLQFEKYTLSLGFGIVLMPYNLVLNVLFILAAIFTPFLLWHLYRAKWYKAISVFFITVVLPFMFFQLLHLGNHVFGFLIMTLPLLIFYCYLWILSHVIGDYLREIDTVRRWERERAV